MYCTMSYYPNLCSQDLESLQSTPGFHIKNIYFVG